MLEFQENDLDDIRCKFPATHQADFTQNVSNFAITSLTNY